LQQLGQGVVKKSGLPGKVPETVKNLYPASHDTFCQKPAFSKRGIKKAQKVSKGNKKSYPALSRARQWLGWG